MGKNKKHKDEYSIRTLAYYQREGGIFNELITILQRIRASNGESRLSSPNKLLNTACEMYDYCLSYCSDIESEEITNFDCDIISFSLCRDYFELPSSFNNHDDKERDIILLLLCSLLAQNSTFRCSLIDSILKYIDIDCNYLKYFEHLLNGNINIQNLDINELKAKNHSLTRDIEYQKDIIKKQDEELANQSNQIADLQNTIVELKQKLTIIKNENNNISQFDKILNLNSILEWIQSRQHYQYTEHVFRMLADLRYRVATDEECDKIKAVEDEMLSKNVGNNIINNNIGLGSNFLTGVAKHPLMPIGVTPEDLINKFIEFMNYGTREGNQN